MTHYLVFALETPTEPLTTAGWVQVASVDALSARTAVQKALEAGDAQADGQFVAVPARSWRPVTVKVETKTALKFS